MRGPPGGRGRRRGRPAALACALAAALLLAAPAAGSEFPERECCDSIPPLPAQFTTPPVSVGTSSSRGPSTTTTRRTSVINLETASTTISCKLARQLCVNDDVCRAITTLIPRLCGQELVACSTVTVTKCQAALRTLVSFQHFQPTCLCKEPRVDLECNTYRNLVFDHPCFTVNRKDDGPYRVHALPTCPYALNVCRKQSRCSRLYDDFVASCRFRNKTCQMTDSSACYNAWNRLRLSPVFGCICPNMQDNDCKDIFELVHRNPCVDDLPQHRHSTSWHSTHYRLHRLLSPPPSPPRPQRPPPPPSRTPALSTVATSWAARSGASPRPVSVVDLAEAGARRRPADSLLVTALANLTTEPTHASTLRGTLGIPGERAPDVIHRPQTRYHVPLDPAPPRDNVFRSSCHEARDDCLRDPHCRHKLEPVLSACNLSTCSRKICMQRLQNFYGGADASHGMEVAFCVCQREPDGGGDCIRAMTQLHPVCAREPESGVLPTCHSVAERCRGQPDGRCRRLLEQYEQACAVDSVTLRCAGPTADCRRAVLAALGTQLRTSCACHGTDTASMDGCRGWKRLLWNNPCVVQAQREFHELRLETREPSRPTLPAPVTTTTTPATTTSRPNRWRPPARFVTTTSTTTSTARSTARRTTTKRPTTTARRREEAPHCVLSRPDGTEERIPVGDGIRFFRADESAGRLDRLQIERECSELCMCHVPVEPICNVVCVEKKSCKSSMAVYPHGSAGLIPFREGCVCYHGKFVCMRPSTDQYTLPFGVFLFLGYSRKDEEILHPFTRKTVKDDTVRELEKMISRIMEHNGESFQDWPCKLSVRQHFEYSENIIIQAKHDGVEESYNNSLNQELLEMEKTECSRPLHDIAFMINNGEPVILSHPLLSVFKMADVDVTIPDVSGGRRAAGAPLLAALAPLLLLVR